MPPGGRSPPHVIARPSTQRSARIYAYQIALRSPLQLPTATLRERRGLVLQLQDEQGRTGLGEASPLPGFSRENLSRCQEVLIDLTRRWLGASTPDSRSPITLAPPALCDSPSARFAFDCARRELESGPLADAIKPDYPLLSGDPERLLQRWRHWPAPYPVNAKLKVGRRPPEAEAGLIRALLQITPALKLRLDANRAWHHEQAAAFLDAVPAAAIEYLEEPCNSLAASLALATHYAIPLALDESLREPGFTLPDSPQLRALILKPGLQGSLGELTRLIDQARARGLRSILSSGYETSLGSRQIAALARQLTPGEAPGLDTQQRFSADLLRGSDSAAAKPLLGFNDMTGVWPARVGGRRQ